MSKTRSSSLLRSNDRLCCVNSCFKPCNQERKQDIHINMTGKGSLYPFLEGILKCNWYPIARCPPPPIRLPLSTSSMENLDTHHPVPSSSFVLENENVISRWLDEEEALISNNENQVSSSMEAHPSQVQILLDLLNLDGSLTYLAVSITQYPTTCSSSNPTTFTANTETVYCTIFSINSSIIILSITATSRFVWFGDILCNTCIDQGILKESNGVQLRSPSEIGTCYWL